MNFNRSDYYNIICENFDINDTETRKILLAVDEADQNQILTNLTSKLYDSIVNKITDIDFGNIPSSAGDITKVENYDKMIECIDVMKNLLDTYKQDPSPAITIRLAIENIAARRDKFSKAFKYDIEFPIVIYNTMVLACVSATSYMIASCVEFIKDPNDESFSIALNKTGNVKTNEKLLFSNLDKFNKACADGTLDKAIDSIISSKVKNFAGVSAGLIAAVASVVIVGILVAIIPVIRELIYLFYLIRVKISDYFAIQADLLDMNAATVEHNTTIDSKKRKEIVQRQVKTAASFRKISNFFEVKFKEAETKAMKEIGTSNKKLKIGDVVDKMPDSAGASSAQTSLF